MSCDTKWLLTRRLCRPWGWQTGHPYSHPAIQNHDQTHEPRVGCSSPMSGTRMFHSTLDSGTDGQQHYDTWNVHTWFSRTGHCCLCTKRNRADHHIDSLDNNYPYLFCLWWLVCFQNGAWPWHCKFLIPSLPVLIPYHWQCSNLSQAVATKKATSYAENGRGIT